MSLRRRRCALVTLLITLSLLSTACSTASSPPGHKVVEHSPSRPGPSASQTGSSPDSSASARQSPLPSPSPSSSASADKPVSALTQIKHSCPSVLSWDDFHRPNRSLHRDRLPTGQRYYASGPDAQRISHDRYVSNVQPATPDILYVWLVRSPATLAARWTFTPGETSGQNAVIGVAPRHAVIGHRHLLGFGIGSVQLAIYPGYWKLLYVVDDNNQLSYNAVGIGYFRHPLRQDGKTLFQMSMTLHPKSSSVSITFPGGHRTFLNTAFDSLWGRLYGIQIRRSSTDGNAQFTAAGASAAPCTASSLLGPLRKPG